MEEEKNPKKPLIFYYIISLIAILLLNAIVVPAVMRKRVTEVDYGQFLNAIERGRVRRVEVDETQTHILFVAEDEAGTEKVYTTAAMNDPDLVNRLYNSSTTYPLPVSYLSRTPSFKSFVNVDHSHSYLLGIRAVTCSPAAESNGQRLWLLARVTPRFMWKRPKLARHSQM